MRFGAANISDGTDTTDKNSRSHSDQKGSGAGRKTEEMADLRECKTMG
jgi:hypothetical protein